MTDGPLIWPYGSTYEIGIDLGSFDAVILRGMPPASFEMRQRLGRVGCRQPRRYSGVSPEKLTDVAVFLAGHKRASLGVEWRAHLSGKMGAGLPADRKVRETAGFVFAAVRYRLQDAADLLWRPVDTVLASRELSNLAVLIATLGVAVVFIRQGGLNGLADNLGSVAIVWGAAFGLIQAGRRWRDVKLPERKPRRKRQ